MVPSVSGGVVVSCSSPHIPLDDFSDDEDDNQAEIGLSVHRQKCLLRNISVLFILVHSNIYAFIPFVFT